MGRSVRLVEIEGKTYVRIDVEVTDEGHLLFSGQDIGEGPVKWWGDEDYEYWLKVDAKDKDRVLLALIKKLYAGNPQVISDFKSDMAEHDIQCHFSSYV